MNFNSQICTTVEQSKHLLELGLKKETADMVYIPHYKDERLCCYFDAQVLNDCVSQYMVTDPSFVDYIPAWSLHRLMEMYGNNYNYICFQNAYGELIHAIAISIEDETFNKDYLEEKQ